MALNSPADNVVGTVICRTAGALQGGGPRAPSDPSTGRRRSSASAVRMSFARHSCTALAPSVTEPPPIVAIKSAPASRAAAAASITALRGVCGGIRSKIPAKRLPSARRISAISSVVRLSVPLTIRNTRSASSRRTSWTIASAAGLPNTTASIAPKATRPTCAMVNRPRLARESGAPPTRASQCRPPCSPRSTSCGWNGTVRHDRARDGLPA